MAELNLSIKLNKLQPRAHNLPEYPFSDFANRFLINYINKSDPGYIFCQHFVYVNIPNPGHELPFTHPHHLYCSTTPVLTRPIMIKKNHHIQ